jgi:hypothetical protein
MSEIHVTCYKCKGLRTNLSSDPCSECGGIGVVARNRTPCPDCAGTGTNPDPNVYPHTCKACNGKGRTAPTAAYKPYLRIIPVEQLQPIARVLAKGRLDEIDGVDIGDFTVGFLAGLMVNMLETLEGYSTEEKQAWLDDLLSAGELVIDHDSIWHRRDGYGARIYRFKRGEE